MLQKIKAVYLHSHDTPMPNTDNISIFLVDDHAVVRNGLKMLIERMGNYAVTAEYDNGQDLLDDINKQALPDIIVLDLSMPVMDGRETVEALNERGIRTPILLLTLETTEQTIIDLFRKGIRGYLPKSSKATVLKSAIDDIVNTGYYHNEMLMKALTTDYAVRTEQEDILDQVTDRERHFLELVCAPEELTYEQIAAQMGVSRRTVDGYRETLFEKFNLRSKTGLVLFALKYGIVELNK